MSDNNKDEKDEPTGPYKTLSVIERTKALGLLPGTPPERKKPPLSPKPLHISSRTSQLHTQDRNTSKTNSTKGKVPPPVIPYRESKKKLQASRSPSSSTSTPVHSPSSQNSPSLEAFNVTSPPASIQFQISIPQSPPVATSSYEEPIIRNISERPPMPEPVEPCSNDGNNGIYSEVDTNVIVGLVFKQDDEYNIAKCGRSDPNVAPPPPLTSGDTYETLSHGGKEGSHGDKEGSHGDKEGTGTVPVAYEESEQSSSDIVAATNNITTTATNVKDDTCKDKDDAYKGNKPHAPKLKPPLPAAKPVKFEQTPPKPKRTYATNASSKFGTTSNIVSSSVDDRLSKPVPLPRGKPEEPIVADINGKEVLQKGLSQNETDGEETEKSNPGPYSYVDIDIPDSPKQIVSSTEQQPPSATVNTSERLKPVSGPKQVTPYNPTTNAAKTVAPQPPNVANKPKRRAPPPPPTGVQSKPKPTAINQPTPSNNMKPPVPIGKPKLTPGHPNTLPDPTPAKPIPPKKWFHLVTKRPASRPSPVPVDDKNLAVTKDAGNTPSSSKRRDSKRKKFFRGKQQSSEDDTVINKTPSVIKEDTPPLVGYCTVGPKGANEKNVTATFQGGGNMTPHTKQRVLATYAEVDLTQKIKKSAGRPLSSSHSEEHLDKLLPELTKVSDVSGKEQFAISPYSTLPRQKSSSNSKSGLPVYTEVKKSKQDMDKTDSVSNPTEQVRRVHEYTEIEIEDICDKRTNDDRATSPLDSLERDQKLLPSTIEAQNSVQQVTATDMTSVAEMPDSPKIDEKPQVPPQTKGLLMVDSPSPQVPPRTADSLMFDCDHDEVALIPAYATVDTRDVVISPKTTKQEIVLKSVNDTPAKRHSLSKEEIADKTKSLGRSLKPKNKPAPLPPQLASPCSPKPPLSPQPIPRARKRISRTQSVEVPSPVNSEAEKVESLDKQTKEPVYESIDDVGLKAAQMSAESKPSPRTADSGSPFLFKNREFIPVGSKASPSRKISTTSCINDDSDDSTDWDSGEEEMEPEEQEEHADQHRGKVYHIAKELLTTERTFVKGLTLLDKDFRQAVLSANRAHDRPVLPEETLNAILSNVGSLCILNGGLLTQLEDRLAKWDSNPKIGDVLLNTAPFFKLYTEYISNFDKALKLLEESCKRNRAFGELVREFESQPICANLPLSGYLLETVQRIPRYKLLLQDYLKHLPEDSDDKSNSERSLELISKVAAHVNESIRQVDNFKKLLDVQKRLVGDTGDGLVSPSRKLLQEGELLKYSRKEIQPRMFFLFTDILIYASAVPPANTTYKVIKRIPLHGMKVSELDDPEVKHGLQIVSTCKSFRLGTNTLEEKTQWMKALQDALFEHEAMVQSRERYRAMSIDPGQTLEDLDESLGILAPPWLPDNCVSMCMMCSVRFNLTKRRHHCRACGHIFCGTCSSYIAALKYQDNKMDRVCQTCFEKLTGKGHQKNVIGDCVSGKKLRQSPKPKRSVAKARSAVLEVRARERNCEISGYLQMKDKRWKKQWLEVAEFALYVFEKHEDVSAKRSISLPGYLVIYPLPDTNDRTQLCITHPGTGSIFFKTESEEVAIKWVEVFQNAVKLKSVSDTM